MYWSFLPTSSLLLFIMLDVRRARNPHILQNFVSSPHRFSMDLRKRDCDGHVKSWLLWSLNHFSVWINVLLEDPTLTQL